MSGACLEHIWSPGLALTLPYLDLSQLRDDLLGSQPRLRYRFSPFQAIFSRVPGSEDADNVTALSASCAASR